MSYDEKLPGSIHPVTLRYGVVVTIVMLAFIAAAPGANGNTITISFIEESLARAGSSFPQDQRVANLCGGVPLICGTTPTAAEGTDKSTDASASTDGNGGSRLSLESADPGNDAFAQTNEEGIFFSNVQTNVHMHSFFPGISLFGVFFSPDSYISYDISIASDLAFSAFQTSGKLTAAGFASSGEDIGAVFDARHHTVTVPSFLVDIDFDPFFCCFGTFTIDVTKTLTLHAANGVEVAIGDIIDPFGISSPLRNGLTFTPAANVPEPSSITLLGSALGLLFFVHRGRRSLARQSSIV